MQRRFLHMFPGEQEISAVVIFYMFLKRFFKHKLNKIFVKLVFLQCTLTDLAPFMLFIGSFLPRWWWPAVWRAGRRMSARRWRWRTQDVAKSHRSPELKRLQFLLRLQMSRWDKDTRNKRNTWLGDFFWYFLNDLYIFILFFFQESVYNIMDHLRLSGGSSWSQQRHGLLETIWTSHGWAQQIRVPFIDLWL